MAERFYLSPIDDPSIECTMCDSVATHYDDDGRPYCVNEDHNSVTVQGPTYDSDAAHHQDLMRLSVVAKQTGDRFTAWVQLGVTDIYRRHATTADYPAGIEDFATHSFRKFAERLRDLVQPEGDGELVAANGRWLTAGELRTHLDRFPADTPVTAATGNGAWWLNVVGASDPEETGEPSIVLATRDDFDTRQF